MERVSLGDCSEEHPFRACRVKRDHKENTVGPWARQKLNALEAYLLAYMTVMKNQPFRLVYVDAFAGAGNAKVRQGQKSDDEYPFLLEMEDIDAEAEFIRGSPRRALELERPFDKYFFFDMDPQRADLLRELSNAFPERKVEVQTREANEAVQKLAAEFRSWDLRGVAFLDPYGAHLHWKTIEALAKTGKFDVIINFPLNMAIHRLIKQDGVIPEVWRQQLDDCFGCSDWFECAYDHQASLFGDERFKRSNAGERLLALYVSRLKKAFGHVSDPSLVLNTKGSPLYHLIWASSNATGRPIAKHILGLGSKVTVPRK